jgi:hypothetical protein
MKAPLMYMRGNYRKQWETRNNRGSAVLVMIGDGWQHLEIG